MKKVGLVFAIAIITFLLVLVLTRKNPTPQNPQSSQIVSSQGTQAALSPTPSGSVPSAAPASTTSTASASTDLASRAASPNSGSAPGEPPVLPPETVVDHARVVMHDYCAEFGENPVGTNPEITAALMGKNPKHINFLTPETGLRVNDKGEMIDGYGTPFFFHQLSGKEMEIRSAGEDRIMWTFDDLVTR